MVYDEGILDYVAKNCDEFEHIISAMGYGYSLVNVTPDNFVRRCSECVNWYDSSCQIFRCKAEKLLKKSI